MRIVMIGSGYVGLVSGACPGGFRSRGDLRRQVDGEGRGAGAGRGADLRAGSGCDHRAQPRCRPPELLARSCRTGVRRRCVFICRRHALASGDGHADLSYVYAAAREIAAAVKGFTSWSTKSTVPSAPATRSSASSARNSPRRTRAVVSNPEFPAKGPPISDFKRPDRIVIGSGDERATELMREVYRPLYLNEAPLYFCERRTSELIKYAANAFSR